MKRLLLNACLAPLAALTTSAAIAQTFPAKQITLVVAYAPGGLGDALARTIAERLTVSLKQPVLVENKPGATGAIATKFVAKANPAAKQKIEDLGAIVRPVSPDEFTEFVKRESAKFAGLVKQIGIKPE